jgi:hypothetical protein
MKPAKETLGIVLGAVSVITFWVPPIGLGIGIAGLAVTLGRWGQDRLLRKTALAACVLGILAFAAFWGTVWALSQ